MYGLHKQHERVKKKNIPHIGQSSTSLPLLRPLYNLNGLNKRAENFNPHLTSNPRQFIPQQERRVESSRSNIQAYARERVSGLECNSQNISDSDAMGIPFIEHGFSLTGRVIDSKLIRRERSDGVLCCLAFAWWGWGHFYLPSDHYNRIKHMLSFESFGDSAFT